MAPEHAAALNAIRAGQPSGRRRCPADLCAGGPSGRGAGRRAPTSRKRQRRTLHRRCASGSLGPAPAIRLRRTTAAGERGVGRPAALPGREARRPLRQRGRPGRRPRRHFLDQPLTGTQPQLVQALAKWRRRQPQSLALFSLLLTTVVGVSLLLGLGRHQLSRRSWPSRKGRSGCSAASSPKPVASLKTGLDLVETIPVPLDLRTQCGQLPRPEQAQAAQELHRFVEQVRALDGAETWPARSRERVEEQCRKFWQHRQAIAEQAVRPPRAAAAGPGRPA